MEKQLTFFDVNEPDTLFFWDHIPEQNQQKIVNTFSILLITNTLLSIKEENDHEK